MLDEAGFQWTASGGQVLRNSLSTAGHKAGASHDCEHRVYRFGGHPLACFFRDDGLSDLIGFSYSNWHAEDAVANLVHHLENIRLACKDRDDAVVAIILDGENAWEHFPENGYHFLDELYRRLAQHGQLKLSTFGDCLQVAAKNRTLDHVVAGSWVYGTLTTWVGHADKNRGWDMLADAKRAFDAATARGGLSAEIRDSGRTSARDLRRLGLVLVVWRRQSCRVGTRFRLAVPRASDPPVPDTAAGAAATICSMRSPTAAANPRSAV